MAVCKYTRADYLSLPEGFPAELIDGMLVKEPSPAAWHQEIVGRLHWILRGALGPGRVLFSPIDLFVDEFNVLQPDLVVLPEDPRIGPDTPQIPVPLVVIEVLSPSTARRDRRTKTRIYLRAGVKEVWLVDPGARRAEIV
ncbi:MAG: Uma2 family endonuclease, partial [Planctomycetota bacterium]